MGQGGADRVTLTLLKMLDRRQFHPTLVLLRREGEFLDDIPTDVPIYDFGVPDVSLAWPQATRLLHQHRPDIILSTSSGTNVLVCLAHYLSRQKSRLVLSERNIVFHGEYTLKRRLMVWLKRLFYGRADLITAISQCLKEDLVEKLGLPADQIFVVYNPVVDDEILLQATEPLDHPWFQEGIPVILGTGRLVKQKDFPTLIRAFQYVRQQRPCRLLILGEGSQRPELETLVQTLGLGTDVELPGFDKNPFKYMARCAVFVQTPIHEGLGNVLIQAMACGAPVISTNCPCGPSEIIQTDGEDGFLVPVGDAQAIAGKILYLLDHPEKREAMAACGRQSAERFRAETILARYVAAIEGTI